MLTSSLNILNYKFKCWFNKRTHHSKTFIYTILLNYLILSFFNYLKQLNLYLKLNIFLENVRYFAFLSLIII